jgi:hypothetical protein
MVARAKNHVEHKNVQKEEESESNFMDRDNKNVFYYI